jgi:hypothetical protein
VETHQYPRHVAFDVVLDHKRLVSQRALHALEKNIRTSPCAQGHEKSYGVGPPSLVDHDLQSTRQAVLPDRPEPYTLGTQRKWPKRLDI